MREREGLSVSGVGESATGLYLYRLLATLKDNYLIIQLNPFSLGIGELIGQAGRLTYQCLLCG